MVQEDKNFYIELSGEIDVTTLEANANGLFTGAGLGEMKLVLKDGENETTIDVHKLTFEGVVSQEKPDDQAEPGF